jgi:asparagine synthase (glutamine-hydrolysing)
VIQRAEYADLKIYLPNDVLVKVDRMSMLHSLEVRCPLLDRSVIELAFRLPIDRKMPRLRPKASPAEARGSAPPAGLARLPKRGFTAPVGAWIRQTHHQLFADDVLGPSTQVMSLLDRATLERTFHDHRIGSADHSYILWAVWVLERWLRWQRAGRNRPVLQLDPA